MTDYSPSALRDLVKKIGHKAIETELRLLPTTGWDGNADDGFYGMSWEGKLPPVTGPTGKTRLRWYMPGLGGSAAFPPGLEKVDDGTDAAGQVYTEYEVDAWASIYEPWMTRIEQAFYGWDDLPEPSGFDGPIEAIRKAVTELTPLPSTSQGADKGGDFDTTFTNVDLESALVSIQATVAEYQPEDMGLLISTFLNGYGPTRVRGIMGNQGQIAIVLGIVLLAEQKIWLGARQDIMAIADAGQEAMRPGGAGGDAINLEVVKAFVDLVAGFVPAPVSTAISATEGVIDIVNMVLPHKPEGSDSVELNGYTVDEVASSIEERIKDLDKRVFDSEYELINTTLEGMLNYLWDNKATQFHINPEAGVAPDLQNAKGLNIHPESLKKVGYSLVPQVAACMGRAAEDAQSGDNGGAWNRTSVGYVFNGPYDKWVEVLNQFDKVTTGSARELVEAGRLLAVGAGWIQDTDGDADKALGTVKDDVDRGELGWDNKPPPPPPTHYTLPSGKQIPF